MTCLAMTRAVTGRYPDRFVDNDLLSNSEILDSIEEDDNPVIVKYYLK
jgi:hypothetical protein